MRYVADWSDWQYGIDIDEVARHFDGAIVKIAEGLTETDHWTDFIAQIEEKGMPWGVYIYTRALDADRAREEAETVIRLLQENGVAPSLGIWYDIEAPDIVGGEGHDGLPVNVITGLASAFISTCNREGYTAGIYAPLWVIQDRITTGELADYVPYWVSATSYASNPLEGTGLNVYGWQYRIDDYPIGDTYIDASEWYV